MLLLQSSKTIIIITGGENSAAFKSVELLDSAASTWRAGPALPINVCCTPMVEDALGGVYVFSGRTLYHLPYADGTWALMPQPVKI